VVIVLPAPLQPGDLIGRIGNSGLSERPHLYMPASYSEDGAYWKGENIPSLIDNRLTLKGRIISKRL
jgi:murein DD-endopeptidase MepM/ murein hydrolase activator NlpD